MAYRRYSVVVSVEIFRCTKMAVIFHHVSRIALQAVDLLVDIISDTSREKESSMP